MGTEHPPHGYGYEIPEPQLASFRRLLETSREQNLRERYRFFREADADLTERLLGFVPLMMRHRWAVVYVPGRTSFAFSIGLYYRFGHPEVMLVGGKHDMQVLKEAINNIGHLAMQGIALEPRTYPSVTLRQPVRLRPVTDALLRKHYYGYGFFFYRHFMDTTDIPLLVARL